MTLNCSKSLNPWQYVGFVAIAALLLFYLADRNGYEGDDLNSICAMFQFDSALRGKIDLYRYPWQPLGYWIGVAVFKLTGSPTAIFMLAPLAGTLTLALLVVYLAKVAVERHSVGFYVAILALMPELWFSGLYYNTSIMAMPLALLAVWLLYERPYPCAVGLAGALAGLAILIRLDFLLICPMLAVIAWVSSRSLKTPLLLALAVCTVLAVALAAQLVTLEQIIADYQRAHTEMVERAQEYGWNRYTKTWVAMMALHPAGWLLLVAGGPLTVRQYWRNDPAATLFYGLAAMPLLYPLPNLLSVKYLLPLLVVLPVFYLRIIEHLTDLLAERLKRFVDAGVLAVALTALLIAVEPQPHSPFIRLAITDARQVGTHDGERAFGAYLMQMLRVERLAALNYHLLAAEELLHSLQQPAGPDVLLAGGENYFANGAVGWRFLQLLAERQGVKGKVAGDHLLLFKFGPRQVWVGTSAEQAMDQVSRQSRDNPLVIDLSNDRLTAEQAYDAVHHALQSYR